jgi:hypothetical protein
MRVRIVLNSSRNVLRSLTTVSALTPFPPPSPTIELATIELATIKLAPIETATIALAQSTFMF